MKFIQIEKGSRDVGEGLSKIEKIAIVMCIGTSVLALAILTMVLIVNFSIL